MNRLRLLLAAIAALVPGAAAARERADLLIRHATMVDVANARLIPDQAVATWAGTIVAMDMDAEIARGWTAAHDPRAAARSPHR